MIKFFKLEFFKNEWRKELSILKHNPFKLAISFSTGIFIGFTPTVGFQTILCFLVSKVFKISFIAALIGASIPTGIPWLIPFLYYGCYKVGEFIFPSYRNFTLSDFKGIKNFISVSIMNFGKPLIAGSLICGVIGSVLSFFIVYFLVLKFKKNEKI